MKWKIEFSPAYSLLKTRLEPGEKIVAESGAMVVTKGDVKVKTGVYGGIVSGFLRKMFGGESFFMNEYTGGGSGGEIWLAPALPGDIVYIELQNSEVHVQDMAYLAHHGNIDIGVKFRGLKGLLAEGEVVWLKLKGTGGVWVSGYGGIDVINLNPGEEVIVDNFHAVAIDGNVKWSIGKFGGWKTFFLGGEGIAIKAKGPGRIFVQTRIIPQFVKLLLKYLPKNR
ncbi:MAG: TIGR00266 family protein [Candidatus Njordarchaeales archaeon]